MLYLFVGRIEFVNLMELVDPKAGGGLMRFARLDHLASGPQPRFRLHYRAYHRSVVIYHCECEEAIKGGREAQVSN